MIKTTVDDLIRILQGTTTKLEKTLKDKSHDYTSANEDALSNFRSAKIIGVDPMKGLLIRVMDKISRIRTFIEKGRLKVTDESAIDAVDDIIGYMILLKGLMLEKSNKEADKL